MNYEGKLDCKGAKILLVASRFNRVFTEQLVNGAIDCLVRHGAKREDIDTAWVPGAFEIPQIVKRFAKSQKGNKLKYDAIIPLGVLIRGETPHFDFLASEVTKGIAQIALESEIPIVFGILTCENMEQAMERASAKLGNKGWDAALSAIELINLLKEFNA